MRAPGGYAQLVRMAAKGLNPTMCPEEVEERRTAPENLTENEFSCDALQQNNVEDDEAIVYACESELSFVPNSSSESSSESEVESQECISGSEDIDTVSASDQEDDTTVSGEQLEKMKPIVVQICSFFQLCYRVSERAVSLLLSFLKTLLSGLGAYCTEIKTSHDVLPQNVYFMRKLLGRKNEIVCFVVCPKCHRFKDCYTSNWND